MIECLQPWRIPFNLVELIYTFKQTQNFCKECEDSFEINENVKNNIDTSVEWDARQS